MKSGSATFTWQEKRSLKLTAYAIEMNRSRLLANRYHRSNLWDDPLEDFRTRKIKVEWQTECNSASRVIIRQIPCVHPGIGGIYFDSVSGHVTKQNRCITKYTDRSEHEDRCIFIDVLIVVIYWNRLWRSYLLSNSYRLGSPPCSRPE